MSQTATDPLSGPKQERALETRRQILESAALAFAEQGYDGTSLNEVIRQSGLTKGAFYFHFPSKEELALATFRYKQEQIVGRTMAEVGDQPDAVAELAAVVRVRARVFIEDPSLRCVPRISSDIGTSAGPGSIFARYQELAIELFAGIVRRGQEEGLLHADLDPRRAGEDIFASLIGADRVSVWLSGGADLIERNEHLLALLLRGLAASSAGDAAPARSRRRTR